MTLQVRNPRTGAFDYVIDPLGSDAVANVAERLRQAQAGWAARTALERAEILLRWADAIGMRLDGIVDALTEDTGRRGISRIEAEGIPRLIRRWAKDAPEMIARAEGGERLTSIPSITARTRLVPYPSSA
jgi:acyl-CoA reductase-like NAD-dependent aldehyde dehydrogenase